jgi:hypothetical protein
MPIRAKRTSRSLTSAARRPKAARRLTKSELTRVITHIVATTPPSRLFELYYWAHEPNLLKLMRCLAALTPTNRSALESFFQFAADRAVVTARLSPRGQLILEARHTGETVCMFEVAPDNPIATPKPH